MSKKTLITITLLAIVVAGVFLMWPSKPKQLAKEFLKELEKDGPNNISSNYCIGDLYINDSKYDSTHSWKGFYSKFNNDSISVEVLFDSWKNARSS